MWLVKQIAHAFLCLAQAADNGTLYGVCLHVHEIVQRPPGILGLSSPPPNSSGLCSRFLVSAPRCYCLLTRVPFFELHYAMLNRLARYFHLIGLYWLILVLPSSNLNSPCLNWMQSHCTGASESDNSGCN